MADKKEKLSTIIGGLFGLGVIALLGLFVFNLASPQPSPHVQGDAWNSGMVLGAADAPNKLVEYSDYFCSHCAVLHHAAGSEFKQAYIDTKKVSFEMRMINILASKVPNTDMGVEAAYCAADQKKFWEYTHEIIIKIEQDYFSKKIGIGPGYPGIPKLPISYFVEPAETAGLDATRFESCVASEKFAKEITANTARASQLGVNGLPEIHVNNFTANGFQGGYDELQTLLKAGGVPQPN
jgi:protein-disulfide isomerase